MPDAVTLIVLVAAGEASNATTRAITRATREALGPRAHVAVREATTSPNDADARAVERSENADAVVELAWSDVRHRKATLRAHVAYDNRWVERSYGFQPSDADFERGRALGFAIASLLPERDKASSSGPVAGTATSTNDTTAAGSTPEAGASVPSVADGSAAAAVPATGASGGASSSSDGAAIHPSPSPTASRTPVPSPGATAAAPPAKAPPAKETQEGRPAVVPSPTPSAASDAKGPPRSPEPLPHETASSPAGAQASVGRGETGAERRAMPSAFAIDGRATIAVPFDGDRASGPPFGAAVSGQWDPTRAAPFVSVRLGLGARYERLAAPYGTVSVLGSAGVALHVLRASPRRPFGAAIHGDWNLLYTWVTAPSSFHRTPAQNPLSSRPDIVIDGTWRLGQGVEVVSGAGVEYAIEPADVTLLGRPARFILPRWLALFEAGFRVRF